MNKEATKTEESRKPSEEKKEEKAGKTSDFGAVGREIKRFEEEAKEEPSEDTETKPEEKPEEKPAERETEEKKIESEKEVKEEEKPEPTLWLLDKAGNKTPFIAKARGKFYTPEDPEKALSWASIAIDSNERNRSIKEREENASKREQALNQYESFLKALDKADKDGKLYVEDEEGNKIRISELVNRGEETEGEEEDDVLVDPEVKDLRKRLKKLEEQTEEDKKARIDAAVEKAKEKIDVEIAEHRKAYPGIFDADGETSPKDIWDVLEGNPNLTVEEAAKISHESEINFIKNRIEKNPDLYIDTDAIYAEKIAEKTKKEEAPIESPSEIPAGTPGQEDKKDKFKGLTYREIVNQGFKDIEASHKSAEKS